MSSEQPTPPLGTDPEARRNPLGLFALVAGIAVILLDGVLSLGQLGLLGGADPQMIQVYGFVTLVVRGLLGVGVTLLGIVALLVRNTSRTLAAAGTALGAASLFGAVVGALYPVVASIAY
ncbi:MAG: hypothetical protein ABWZ77_05840, partial [Naasia sp.]